MALPDARDLTRRQCCAGLIAVLERQNQQLLELSGRILDLTTQMHALTIEMHRAVKR